MEILGVKKLVAQLRARAAKARKDNASVSVGYQTNYAIYVHENLQANHPVGQAKYLTGPARELAGEMASIARRVFERGGTTAQALLLAGLRLQRESQKKVPVDTGVLKNSAFTSLDKKGEV